SRPGGNRALAATRLCEPRPTAPWETSDTWGSGDCDRNYRRTARTHRWGSVRRAHQVVPSGKPRYRASPSAARAAQHGDDGTSHRRGERYRRLPTVGRWAGALRSHLGSRWHAAAWDYSGMGWGGSPQGRRSNGLWSVARYWRVIRRYRVVVSSDR